MVNCRVVSRHVLGEHVQYTSIHITSKKWPILHNLEVGENIALVKEYLGAPNKEADQMLIYHGETHEVHFNYKNNMITKIDFLYYAD